MPVAGDDAKLRWEDGVPVSVRHDDPYYARADGLAETRHVFLDGNGLAARFRGAARFHVAELGFGTGLNCLAAWALWREMAAPGAVLRFTSFERDPMTPEERSRALSAFPELAGLAEALATGETPGLALEVIEDDARATLPTWTGIADAWFLDGFAPARNPDMWEPALLAAVHARTVPGGTFATYTAAGHVRRCLAAAGFEVARRPGFGSKREMLAGHRP